MADIFYSSETGRCLSTDIPSPYARQQFPTTRDSEADFAIFSTALLLGTFFLALASILWIATR